jgi:hypothetical protein
MILLSKLPIRGFILWCLLLCGNRLVSAAPGSNQVLKPATLPSARVVLDRYIAVTGGVGAWHSKRTERDEIEGRSLDGHRVLLRASVALTRQGNSLNEVKIPEEAREGVYNGVAWAWTKLSGPRIKRGPDRDEAIRSSRMLEEADWRTLYPKSRVESVEPIEGKPCYKVLMLPSTGQKTEWFDVATGLLVRRASVALASAGVTPVSYTVEAWRVQDGLKQPVTMLALRGDLRYRLQVLSLAYNELRDPEDIRYPAQVEGYLNDERAGKALPSAEELIERHIFESGGFAAYAKLKTQKITGNLEFLSRNMEARTETWSAGDGRYYQFVDIPGLGKQEEGSDGHVLWERSPVLGPRAKPRGSLAGLGITLDAAGVVGWRYLVGEVRTEARETIDRHDCYRVLVRSRDGSQNSTRWYDRKTGLLYRTSVSYKTNMGAVPAVLTYESWRSVEGLKWPVQIHMQVSGQELRFTADEVVLNAAMDDRVFRLPEEIRNLNGPRTTLPDSMADEATGTPVANMPVY